MLRFLSRPLRPRFTHVFLGALFVSINCLCQSNDVIQIDSVILQNGDRISGQIVAVDADKIELKHELLGSLQIPSKAVQEVRATSGYYLLQSSEITGQHRVRFANASFQFVNGTVRASIDASHIQVPSGVAVRLSKERTQLETSQEHTAAPPVVPSQKSVSATPATQVQFSLNAPETVVDGTQSQESFGGNVGILYRLQPLCGPASWYTALLLSETHMRNWKVRSQANVTDMYDGTLSVKNQVFSGSKTSFFGVADLFGNSSLGIGLQQSYGGGLSRVFYASGCNGQPHNYILSLAGDASLRHLHQRLYAPGTDADFLGLNLRQSLSFTPLFKDKSGNQIERFGFDLSLWEMPTLNDIKGIQAGGALSISAPVGGGFSLMLTEEDDYINNAPKAKRKNYVKSGLTLNYTFPVLK